MGVSLIQKKRVLAAKMVNNQLPPCTFSTTEFQRSAFTPVKRHPLQEFEPKLGWAFAPGCQGLYPELHGTSSDPGFE